MRQSPVQRNDRGLRFARPLRVPYLLKARFKASLAAAEGETLRDPKIDANVFDRC